MIRILATDLLVVTGMDTVVYAEIGNLHHAARLAKRQDGMSAENKNSITP